MKTKLVLKGTNTQEEKLVIALQLRPKENKVDIYTFPEADVTDEFEQQLMQEWRNGSEVSFPENHTHIERELAVTESLLPEDILVERTDIINRAQTEWHFIVLSSKLNEVYETELGELKEKVDQLSAYSSDVWNDLKGFWAKVQDQVRDRNLFREHANALRDNTNVLFGRLKELRAALDAEFQNLSQTAHDSFIESLQTIEQRANEGGKLSSIFDELKSLQHKFREAKLTREHRSLVWERLDGAFKMVKEKRFGSSANNESSAMERLQRRYNGLINAIEKMERSIDRDRKDLEFQRRKIADTDGQLEAQIRQAKIKMIEERIRSKEEKFGEMNQTKVELEGRIEAQKTKDAKRAERNKIEDAKRAAKQKIAAEIKNAEVARESDSEKLEKAASAISQKAKKKAATEAPATVTTEALIDNAVATAAALPNNTTSSSPSNSEEE